MSSPAERPKAKSLHPLLALRPILRPYWPMMVGAVFALEDVVAAMRSVADGQAIGKVVLEI